MLSGTRPCLHDGRGTQSVRGEGESVMCALRNQRTISFEEFLAVKAEDGGGAAEKGGNGNWCLSAD